MPIYLCGTCLKWILTYSLIYLRKYFSTFEPILKISAHSNHFQKSQHVWTIFKNLSTFEPFFKYLSTFVHFVVFIYAPKHIMPSILRALSLDTHTHSAHIHARNLFTFMQRYLYCAPCGARIGVWCWKTPCGKHANCHKTTSEVTMSWRLLVS